MNGKQANELSIMIGNLISNGIMLDDIKMPFTALDYFSITNLNPKEVYSIIKANYYHLPKEDAIYRSLFLQFCINKIDNITQLESTEEDILNEHNVFINNDVRYEPTMEDISKVFELFENNNITKNHRLIYTALYRYSKDLPILPLISDAKLYDNAEKTR